jgi:hypothetical protein
MALEGHRTLVRTIWSIEIRNAVLLFERGGDVLSRPRFAASSSY